MIRILRWVGVAAAALVLTACGGGDGGGSAEQPPAPTVLIRASAAGATTGDPVVLQTHLGGTVSLDGSGSVAGSGSLSAYAWTVSSRPTGSSAVPGTATAAKASFVPDVVGDYVLTLRVTDAGGSAETALRLTVGAALPLPAVTTNVVFSGPSVTRPTQSVTLGSTITMDASASVDPASGTVAVAWVLVAKPAGSAVTVPDSGASVTFVPDLAGTYTLRARGTTSGGSTADVVQGFEAAAYAPAVAVATNVSSSIASSRTLTVALGNMVSLNGNVGYYGQNYSTTWALESKPSYSTVTALTTSNVGSTSFAPDVPGSYAAVLTVRDNSSGLSTTYRVTVVANYGPTAEVTGSAAPIAAASGPSFVASTGAPVTLRGSGSFDPAGAALTYQWRVVTRPSYSTATLATDTEATTRFTPDNNGSYVLELVVTNTDGYSATQQVTLYVGNYPPVAAVTRAQVTVLVGGEAKSSAITSYSQSGNALTYSWAIDARPAGSTAAIASPDQAGLSFTPDVAGTYNATVTVNDGTFSAVTPVVIAALAPSAGTMPLTYTPLLSRYSKSLGKVVIVSAGPNELHLVDPGTGTDTAIALPTTVKALSLSSNGQFAAVLHEGTVSLVNLATSQLVRSSLTGGTQTDVAVSDSGMLYIAGNVSFSSYGLVVINGLTGARVQDYAYYLYGTVRLALVDNPRRLIAVADGSSTLYATTVDTNTEQLLSTTGVSSNYYSYVTTGPWLSADQGLLFLSSGAYFGTGDLRYVNSLGIYVQSLSYSASADEAIALVSTSNYSSTSSYPSVAQRYAGSLLFPAGELPLPKISGAQAYGMAVFHRADDKRIFVVQTGSPTPLAQGVQYYVIVQ